MASRKEFEMLFKLNAQLNSGFSNGFKSAQQAVTQMQNELQALNSTQADISAYQKQQEALEGTKGKLELLQQQYDNIQQEISETEGFSASLENRLLSKQKQIERTSASIEQQEGKLEQMGNALREAGVDTENLTGESKRLETEYEQLKKSQEEIAEGYKEDGDNAVSFGEKAADAARTVESALVAAGITALLKEIADAYMECINVAGDFEESMSNVEALSGASETELAELSDLAKELGATTKFTAKQSADAMGYMAMAGWDAQQMLSGMPGVLQLAAASGEDLAQVSDIVTDSMTAFGLTAADTSRYADVLAATAANANTSVSVMGESFKYAAPVAGALGYSVEDVSVALGLMANAGIKGSNAGTALRNTFNGLLEGVTLTGGAFGEFEFSAVQADGTMMDFGSTINTLRDYFGQMTEAERVNNAMTIAGQRGYAGLLSILNATDSDFNKLTASIENSTGAAQRMADVKMDNMNGQLTLLNSAWEAVQTTIGEQFTPSLQEAYGEGAKILSDINSFLQQNPKLIKAVTAGVAVVGTATAGIVAFTAASKLAAIAAEAVTSAIPGVNVIIGVTAAVALLAAAVASVGDGLTEEERELRELTAVSREQYAELQDLRTEYEEVCDTIGETSAEAQLLKAELDDATEAFEENKRNASDVAEEYRKLSEAHEELMSSYNDSIDGINKEFESNDNLITKLQELMAVEHKTAGTKQEILTIVDLLNESIPDLNLAYDASTDSLNMTAEAVRNLAKAEAERETIAAKQDQLKKLYQEQGALETAAAETAKEAAAREREYQAALTARDSILDNYKAPGTFSDARAAGGFAEVIKPYNDALHDAEEARNAANEAEERAATDYAENQKLIEELSEEVAEYNQETEALASSSAELVEALDDTFEKAKELGEAYTEAYESALSSFEGQFGLFDKASTESETYLNSTVANAQKALDSQLVYWDSYYANVQILKNTSAEDLGITQENYDLMMSYVQDGSEEAAGLAASMVSAIQSGDAEAVGHLADTAGQVATKQKEIADFTAEWQTNFSGAMEELLGDLQETVSEMDLSDEAAQSGYNTIEGFISAAQDESLLSRVSSAYAAVAQRAQDAINNNLDIHSPSGKTEWSGEMAGEGLIVGVKNTAADMEREMKTYTNDMLEAMTPENSQIVMLAPQLMEQLASMRTSAAPELSVSSAAGGGIVIHIHPEYHIESNDSEESIEDQLRRNDEYLREMVREELEEIGVDARRVSFE